MSQTNRADCEGLRGECRTFVPINLETDNL
jgi:hypothetical protein